MAACKHKLEWQTVLPLVQYSLDIYTRPSLFTLSPFLFFNPSVFFLFVMRCKLWKPDVIFALAEGEKPNRLLWDWRTRSFWISLLLYSGFQQFLQWFYPCLDVCTKARSTLLKSLDQIVQDETWLLERKFKDGKKSHCSSSLHLCRPPGHITSLCQKPPPAAPHPSQRADIVICNKSSRVALNWRFPADSAETGPAYMAKTATISNQTAAIRKKTDIWASGEDRNMFK